MKKTSVTTSNRSGYPIVGRSHVSALAALILVALAPIGTALAASINYGSFMGTTTVYEMVQEATNSVGDAPPKFGPPATIGVVTPGYPAVPCVMCGIPGDTLDFNPVGFGASASGAGGIDVTDGNLTFMASAKPGLGLANLLISELGDTTMSGFGTDATFTSVTLNGVLKINSVGGATINPISIPIAFSSVGPSGGTYGLQTDFGGGPGGVIQWSGSALVDLTTANPLVAAGYAAQNLSPRLPVTKVSVNFDNTLVAISQQGTSALIAKKDQLIITTNIPPGGGIPEPATATLALLMIAGGAAVRRR